MYVDYLKGNTMKKTIEEYNLVDFVKKVQAEILDGWEIDFEDGDSVPHSHIGYYTCKVTKGKPIAALLQPLEQPQDILVNALPPSTPTEYREPFTPSVVFTVETPEVTQTKKVGRPKGSTI